jgi:hypothetical protein
MKVSKNSLILTAALTGLLGGTVARAAAPPTQDTSKQDTAKSKKSTAKVEKHSCAGKNSCKGNGGCKTSDQGCKAKNSCKGKGGCATDGSKK